jgi:hypothetical protein
MVMHSGKDGDPDACLVVFCCCPSSLNLVHGGLLELRMGVAWSKEVRQGGLDEEELGEAENKWAMGCRVCP